MKTYLVTGTYHGSICHFETANKESQKHNKEHVTNELIKRGFVKGCSFVSCWGKTHTDSSGIFNFEQFCEENEWVVFMDRTSVYADGKYATIINPMQAKLEEAKLKYPIGTEFYGSLSKMRFKVCNGIKIGEDIKTNLYGIDSNGNSVGCIYCGSSDTWAEIIPQDKGAVLIEQAKKMYPKGTKYKPVESMFPVNEVTSELRYGYYGNDGIDCDEGGFVYLNGIWATIIEEPIMIDGKEVSLREHGCYLGEQYISKEAVISLQSLNPIFPEILERMEEKNGDNQQGEK